MSLKSFRSTFPILLCLIFLASGCATVETRSFRATGYCNCRKCCSWTRGSWKYLKLNFWNRYVSTGPRKGKPYDGRTAGGTKPRQPAPGLISLDSIQHPWMVPFRVVFFPWLFLPHDGTIAADTAYYSFGTRLYIPDYGWGMVEDRGSAIKGSDRLDLYFRSHHKALNWGSRQVDVEVYRNEER